ncbi:MAG: outer membrane lipoprotein chaperone LolA [Oleiphilus sp.]
MNPFFKTNHRKHNNRLNIKILLSVLLFSVASLVHAQQEDSPLNRLVATLAEIKTFSGTFVQYAVDQKGARIQESRGELKADRSGLFYWHTTEPLEQTVVSNGSEVTVYDPDLEQATIQAIGNQVQTTPAILFSGDTEKIGEMFTVDIRSQVASSIQYSLKPKNQESLFELLMVRFEGQNLKELRITDALGQESTMSFVQTQINQTFSDDTFQLTLPEGTDIIRDIPTK